MQNQPLSPALPSCPYDFSTSHHLCASLCRGPAGGLRSAGLWAARLLLVGFALVLGAILTPARAITGPNKFIPTFLVYYGSGPTLTASDAPNLARFDLLDIDRYRYHEIGTNTWSSIKAYNPAVEIYLYEMGAESASYLDSYDQMSINSLARYDNSRGHPMGSLNGNHPELFLLDSNGNRVYSLAYSSPANGRFMHLMDFGSSTYQSYWVTAVKADINDQPWKADGVFADVCVSVAAAGGYNATSAKYPSDSSWSAAMNSFLVNTASGLHNYGQKFWCNKGASQTSAGRSAWAQLDSSWDHPDVLLEEGAFAVGWGSAVQFYPEADWRNQVDVLATLTNTKLAYMSHTQLTPGQSGTDNWGRPVTFWQAFYYSMASMLLGKNADLNNAFFMFNQGDNFGYSTILRYPEYDNIDLGRPLGGYIVSPTAGVNIYWREFERGYVAVNPTASDVASFAFPQPVKPITHDNLLAQSSIANVNAVALKGHNAAIVLKSTTVVAVGATPGGDTTAPSPPSGMTAVAVSSVQVSLSWTAATDNVGVTGYKFWRNGVMAATLGAWTQVQDTGLNAGTSYTYTLQAFDAAGNVSTQSAPVSVTTPGGVVTGGDTTAPTPPTGVTAVPVSSTQISLSWTAGTDDVGVAGYYFYRNGEMVATLGAVTLIQDTGLNAGTQYTYTMQAFDAAGNVSAQSVPVSATTAGGVVTVGPG